MNKLLLATTNPAKIRELTFGLQPLIQSGVQIISLKELQIDAEPEETGKTFCENAELKAKFYANLTGLPSLADDGGFMIDSLNGEPGVKSRRWKGYDCSDEELIEYTLKRLQGFPKEDRTAKGSLCLCFYHPNKMITISEEESIEGWMAEHTSGKAMLGFPYRALFIVKKFNKYYDELTKEEHSEINHRLKTVKRIVEKIEDIYNL